MVYNQSETNHGKLMGFLFVILLGLCTMACSGQEPVTEDFSKYTPAPQTISTTSPDSNLVKNAPVVMKRDSNSQRVPTQNVNPVQAELKREGRTLLYLVLGILGTAVIIKATNMTNAITTDYN